MKFILTMPEIKEIIKEKYGFDNTVQIEIDMVNTFVPSFYSGVEHWKGKHISDFINFIDDIDYISTSKIKAIKNLREFCDANNVKCSLTEAKMTIENWTKFKDYVHFTGHLPYYSNNSINCDDTSLLKYNI